MWSGREALRTEVSRHPSGVVPIERGDLLLLNSGRFFHEVTTVEGARPRFTIGGFFAKRRGGEGVVYWA